MPTPERTTFRILRFTRIPKPLFGRIPCTHLFLTTAWESSGDRERLFQSVSGTRLLDHQLVKLRFCLEIGVLIDAMPRSAKNFGIENDEWWKTTSLSASNKKGRIALSIASSYLHSDLPSMPDWKPSRASARRHAATKGESFSRDTSLVAGRSCVVQIGAAGTEGPREIGLEKSSTSRRQMRTLSTCRQHQARGWLAPRYLCACGISCN